MGRPKDLEKRKHILDAAKALFLKCGYHGSSMNQIAKEAGVTKLTVYNHFQDKDNLFVCAIEETCESAINSRPLALNAQSDFKEELYKSCESGLNTINLPEAIKLEHLILELAAENNPLANVFYNASHKKMCSIWEDFFRQAAQFNFIRQDNTEKQTQLMLSLLLGVRHHEVLLGIRQIPTAQEQHEIILESIEIFLMKYGVH